MRRAAPHEKEDATFGAAEAGDAQRRGPLPSQQVRQGKTEETQRAGAEDFPTAKLRRQI